MSGAGPEGGTFGHIAELSLEYEQAGVIITTKEREMFVLRIHDLNWL